MAPSVVLSVPYTAPSERKPPLPHHSQSLPGPLPFPHTSKSLSQTRVDNQICDNCTCRQPPRGFEAGAIVARIASIPAQTRMPLHCPRKQCRYGVKEGRSRFLSHTALGLAAMLMAKISAADGGVEHRRQVTIASMISRALPGVSAMQNLHTHTRPPAPPHTHTPTPAFLTTGCYYSDRVYRAACFDGLRHHGAVGLIWLRRQLHRHRARALLILQVRLHAMLSWVPPCRAPCWNAAVCIPNVCGCARVGPIVAGQRHLSARRNRAALSVGPAGRLTFSVLVYTWHLSVERAAARTSTLAYSRQSPWRGPDRPRPMCGTP